MKQKTNLLLQPALVLGVLMFFGYGGYGAFGQRNSTQPGAPNQNEAQNEAQNQAQNKDQSAAQASSTSSTEQSNAASASTADNAQNAKVNSTTAQEQDKDSEAVKHKVHVRLGGVAVGAGYAYSSGPFCCYGYYPYSAFYNPFFYPAFYPDPFYDLYGYPPYDYRNDLGYAGDKGEIRLSSSVKGAQVYIDGAYAGTADKLKNFWLAPGAYNVSVSAAGRQTYKERVYVLSGKSVKLKATLEPEQPVHAQGEAKP